MYIKNTGFGYGVYQSGYLVREFLTYEEAADFKDLMEGKA